MNKNKRGFTLIELLATIVIIAIVALIAVPIVLDLINDARRQSFLATARGIIKAGDFYYSRQEMNGEEANDTVFQFPTHIEGLKFSGTVPKSGAMVVTDEGDIALAISNGKFCASKGYNDRDITITKDEGNCYFPYTLRAIATTSEELGIESIAECLSNGETCEAGTPFAIKVNDEDIYKFRVLKDEDNVVTLIMSSNLYEKENNNPDVAWINQADYEAAGGKSWGTNTDENKFGPMTLLRKLKERTATWTNLEDYSYELNDYEKAYPTYSGEYVQNVKVRLPNLLDVTASEIGCTRFNATCKGWLSEGVYQSGDDITHGFWLTDASLAQPSNGWYIRHDGGALRYTISSETYLGIRPVIEITKQYEGL